MKNARSMLSLMVEYDNRITAIQRSMKSNDFVHPDLMQALAVVRQTLREIINAERQSEQEKGGG